MGDEHAAAATRDEVTLAAQVSVGRQVDIVINVNRVRRSVGDISQGVAGKSGPDDRLGVQGGAGVKGIAVDKDQLLPGEIEGPPGKVVGLAVVGVVRAGDELQGGQDRVPRLWCFG